MTGFDEAVNLLHELYCKLYNTCKNTNFLPNYIVNYLFPYHNLTSNELTLGILLLFNSLLSHISNIFVRPGWQAHRGDSSCLNVNIDLILTCMSSPWCEGLPHLKTSPFSCSSLQTHYWDLWVNLFDYVSGKHCMTRQNKSITCLPLPSVTSSITLTGTSVLSLSA